MSMCRHLADTGTAGGGGRGGSGGDCGGGKSSSRSTPFPTVRTLRILATKLLLVLPTNDS